MIRNWILLVLLGLSLLNVTAAQNSTGDIEVSPVANVDQVTEESASPAAGSPGSVPNPDARAALPPSEPSNDTDPSSAAVKDATSYVKPFQCYTCDSLEDPNRCSKVEKLELKNCDQSTGTTSMCHYIIGDLEENKKLTKNYVQAGCGPAPAARFAGSNEGVLKTKHSEVKCRSVDFTHADLGDTPMQPDYQLSFKGKSCNCVTSECNKNFRNYFVNENSASSSTISVFGLASLFVFVRLF